MEATASKIWIFKQPLLSISCIIKWKNWFFLFISWLILIKWCCAQYPGLSIQCARVGGVEIPNNKRIEYSLQYIHGVGRTRARQILVDLKMENKITKDMSEEELITIRDEVSKYMIEGDLVIIPYFFVRGTFWVLISLFENFFFFGGFCRGGSMHLLLGDWRRFNATAEFAIFRACHVEGSTQRTIVAHWRVRGLLLLGKRKPLVN